MDWLVGLLLLAVGVIIGFFVAKYVYKGVPNASDKSTNEQTIQELMNQQASQHIQETKEIIDNLSAQSAALKEQLEGYEQLLIANRTQAEGDPQNSSLSYFGEHASVYLRNKSKTPVREKSSADVQPLDFSSQSSGLFSGSEETPVKETK